MTPDEQRRLATVEANQASMQDWMEKIAADLGEIKKAALMGKGALMLLAKIGLYLGAAAAALDWLNGHLHIWGPK